MLQFDERVACNITELYLTLYKYMPIHSAKNEMFYKIVDHAESKITDTLKEPNLNFHFILRLYDCKKLLTVKP